MGQPNIGFTLQFDAKEGLVVFSHEYDEVNCSSKEAELLPKFINHMKNAAIRFIHEYSENVQQAIN